jgi:hypothetical protein
MGMRGEKLRRKRGVERRSPTRFQVNGGGGCGEGGRLLGGGGDQNINRLYSLL